VKRFETGDGLDFVIYKAEAKQRRIWPAGDAIYRFVIRRHADALVMAGR